MPKKEAAPTSRTNRKQALLQIAREGGTTASHLTRTLGISRQLASRLESEAEKGH